MENATYPSETRLEAEQAGKETERIADDCGGENSIAMNLVKTITNEV